MFLSDGSFLFVPSVNLSITQQRTLPLLKATMSNWVGAAAEKWCMPIVENMHEQLIAGQIIHADETTVQVLHEEGRKATSVSRMWVYCNGKINDRNIIIFDYQPTRKGEHASNFLKGFIGYLICDGYDAYNAVEGAKRCGCMTHTTGFCRSSAERQESIRNFCCG